MRLIVAAVGRLKDAERELCERYSKRFDAAGRSLGLGPLAITELSESRAASADARKADEAARLLKAAGAADVRVVLDEGGKALSSEAFAKWIAQRRDGGAKGLALLIGGPDGAALKLSLGAMTLPHGMARAVLIEQLYRAATILSGHPYHRA
jgi:23S rRNA (pseudouridine1915-N3)-methyltransferase